MGGLCAKSLYTRADAIDDKQQDLPWDLVVNTRCDCEYDNGEDM